MTSPYGHPQGVGIENSIWSVDRGPFTTAARAATTANIADLSAASVSQDGVTLVAGDRLLAKNQSAAAENGIYAVGEVTAGVAALYRVSPMDDGEVIFPGASIYIEAGTASGGEWWYVTNTGTITVGTTELTFSQLVGSIPDELNSTSNGEGASLIGIEDAGTLFTADNVEDALAEVKALADAAPAMQAVDATLADGTITIDAGITVAANSEVIPLLIGALTGSTNFASLGELKASRVTGAPGTGEVVIQAYGANGALDADAAGAIRVVILTPQT